MQPVETTRLSTDLQKRSFWSAARGFIPLLIYVCLVLCTSLLKYTPLGRAAEYTYGIALALYLWAGLISIKRKRHRTAASFLIPPAFIAVFAAATPNGWIEGRSFELFVDIGFDPISEQCRRAAISSEQIVYCKHTKYLLVSGADGSMSLVYDKRDQIANQIACRDIERLMSESDKAKLPWPGISTDTEVFCRKIVDHYFSVTTPNLEN